MSVVAVVAGRKPRRDCRYSLEERTVLDKFKEKFLQQTTKKQRAHMTRSEILPAMFDFWTSNGAIVMSEAEVEKRVGELGYFLANNWRNPAGLTDSSRKNIDVRAIDVVLKLRQEAVQIRICHLLGVGSIADAKHDDVFACRMTAASQVIGLMTPEEKADLQAEVERIRSQGWPSDIQRARAEKAAKSTTESFAAKAWKEMGMLTITFGVFTGINGKLYVDSYDTMAENAGVMSASFLDLHNGLENELATKLLDYVKTLHLLQKSTPVVPNVPVALIKEDANGYPLMPAALAGVAPLKDDLVAIVRQYMKAHHKLASAGRTDMIRWTGVISNVKKFIAPEYLPKNFVLKDPHNLKTSQLIDLMDHIRGRQDVFGASNAFRLKRFIVGVKDYPTCYPDEADKTGLPLAKGRATKRKQAKKKVLPPVQALMADGLHTIRSTPTPSESSRGHMRHPSTIPQVHPQHDSHSVSSGTMAFGAGPPMPPTGREDTMSAPFPFSHDLGHAAQISHSGAQAPFLATANMGQTPATLATMPPAASFFAEFEETMPQHRQPTAGWNGPIRRLRDDFDEYQMAVDNDPPLPFLDQVHHVTTEPAGQAHATLSARSAPVRADDLAMREAELFKVTGPRARKRRERNK